MTMICHANNGQVPTDVSPIPGALRNKANPTLSDMIADGWLLCVKSDTPHIKASHWTAVQDKAYVEIVDEVWTQEELDAQAVQAATNAATADLQANGERYVAENEYILLCDMLANTEGAHVKLGIAALQMILVGMLATAPARENALFQYLMGLQVALQRLGGVNWWDTCTWHDYADIVNAAGERHNAIVAILP